MSNTESPTEAPRGVLASPGLMGGCYAAALALTGVAVFLGTSPTLTGPLGPASPVVLALLALGAAVLIPPAGGLVRRMVRLLRARERDVGARLHLRFIFLFALAAAAPAVIVALFF